MSVELIPVGGNDDATIDAFHDVVAAVRAADEPDQPPRTREATAGMLRHPSPSRSHEPFLVLYDGRPAATLRVDRPEADNTHLMFVDILVHPQTRRRGIGRQLFRAAVDIGRANGRDVLLGQYCVPLPGGPERDPAPAAFAAAVDARPALLDIRSRIDLDTVEAGSWDAEYEASLQQAEGYSLLWWAGAQPEELLADIAYLEGRMVTDSPIGELAIEQENVDGDRIRALDEMLRHRGSPHFQAGAREDATGRLVAWTILGFETGQTTRAWQGTTIVDPDHRGHRLGMLVKLENLRHTWQVQPALRHIDTWNADENKHMIAINHSLGFRPVDGWVNWQYGAGRV